MNSFKLVTWNVNSIRIRLTPLELLCRLVNPDVICLQEVKAKEEQNGTMHCFFLGAKLCDIF